MKVKDEENDFLNEVILVILKLRNINKINVKQIII